MRMFDHRRLKMAISFSVLVMVLILLLSLDMVTFSRYETRVTSSSALDTAIYLVNDTYQTVQVKLPDIMPSNNVYQYTFSVSNFNEDEHCETNLLYKLHIRTTTNMHIDYELYNTLDIQNAESCILSDDTVLDPDGTYFRHIYTEEVEFLYTQDEIEYYTLVFTFPSQYNDYEYNSNVDYIEINVESRQKLSTDV